MTKGGVGVGKSFSFHAKVSTKLSVFNSSFRRNYVALKDVLVTIKSRVGGDKKTYRRC